MTVPPPEPHGGDAGLARIAGAVLAGALFAAAGAVVAGTALDLLGRVPGPARAAAEGFRGFLNAGGWARLPLWGGALGALRALGWTATGRARAVTLALAVGLLALSWLPGGRPPTGAEDLLRGPGGPRRAPGPRAVAARAAAIRRWSYESPDGVRRILALANDPDPLLREQVALALGVNLIVSDLEHAGPDRPARFAALPLVDSVRAGLLVLLRDPVEPVRAEAARALWKAPRTFGTVTPAAETLAAVLGRAPRPGMPERLLWLALDAAAGAPDARLKRAAADFAASTADTALARAARLAASPAGAGTR